MTTPQIKLFLHKKGHQASDGQIKSFLEAERARSLGKPFSTLSELEKWFSECKKMVSKVFFPIYKGVCGLISISYVYIYFVIHEHCIKMVIVQKLIVLQS